MAYRIEEAHYFVKKEPFIARHGGEVCLEVFNMLDVFGQWFFVF